LRIYGLPRSGRREELAERAVDFLKRKHDKPFFLNFWIHEPHVPHHPSQASLDLFSDLDERSRVYAAVVFDADQWVGRILDTLKETGLDQNTLVIFSSDNGPAERRDDPNNPLGQYYDMGSTGGLRGHKGLLYDGGVRVPFIVRWPEHVPAGRVDETTVLSAVDLLTTFCAVGGAAIPENYLGEGESILPALEGTS